MQLIIDTSDNKTIKLALMDKRRLAFEVQVEAAGRQAEKLLPAIDAFLMDNGLNWKQINDIKTVVNGSGFTSLRIGVATANALAYALGKPISPSRKRQGVSVASPRYSSPANIGPSKKNNDK